MPQDEWNKVSDALLAFRHGISADMMSRLSTGDLCLPEVQLCLRSPPRWRQRGSRGDGATAAVSRLATFVVVCPERGC
eukprot:8390270-Alexandrium_andersonii.AAC.1